MQCKLPQSYLRQPRFDVLDNWDIWPIEWKKKKKVNSVVWKSLTVICHITLNPDNLTDCRGMHVYHVNLMHLRKTSKYTLIMNFQVTQVLSLRLQSQTWRKVCWPDFQISNNASINWFNRIYWFYLILQTRVAFTKEKNIRHLISQLWVSIS